MENLNNLNGAVILETPRLVCRRWLCSDYDAIFSVYSDPDVSKWIGNGHPITRDQCRAWLEVTANNYGVRGYGMFALEDRTTCQTVGFCGLVHPDGQVDAEIKYAFQKSYWGQGLASEVIPAIVAYAAEGYELTKIIATVAPENLASQHALLKANFLLVEERTDVDGLPEQLYEWRAGRDFSP